MPGNVVPLTTELATKIRDKLLEQQEQVKVAEHKAQDAMTKLASVTQENEVLRTVLQLVADGAFDPHDAMDKVASFMVRPTDLQVYKQAHDLGIDGFDTRLGTPVKDVKPASGAGNPLAECLEDLLTEGLIGLR